MSSKAPRVEKKNRWLSANTAAKLGREESVKNWDPVEPPLDVREDGLAVGVLLALAALYFLPALMAGNSRVLSAAGTDIWHQYFYWRHFGFNALAAGEMPLWNPYIFSGTPYIAGIQSAIFYPLNIIYLLLETAFAINLSIALHCFLTSLFAYLFGRYLGLAPIPSFFSAVTFAYGAPYFLHIYAGHLSNLSTMTWLPLLFLGAEAYLRNAKIKYALLTGLALSMQVLAGHPQYVFYGIIAVALYFVFSLLSAGRPRRLAYRFGGFCLIVVVGLSIAAVQLLPSVEITRQSIREALTYEWVSQFSLPPENFITLLLPDFFGDMVALPYWGKNYLWEMSIYLGIVPPAAAVAALVLERSRPVKIFSFIAVTALLLALGKHTPLLRILYNTVPGFDLFRGLSKFVYVFAFACSLLAGCGLAKIVALAESRSEKVRWAGGLATGLAASLFLVAVVGYAAGQSGWRFVVETYSLAEERYFPLPSPAARFVTDSLHLVLWGVFKASVFLCGFGAPLLLFGRLKTLSPRRWSLLAVALTVLDLWLFGFRYLTTFDPKQLSLDADLKTFFQWEKEPFRVATPVFSLLNAGLLDGIENAGGYDAIVLRRYSEFINLTQGIPVGEPNIAMSIARPSPLLRALNVKYYIFEPSRQVDLPELALVFESRRYKVYQDRRALPRSFIVHEARAMTERNAVLRALSDPEFNPAATAVVDEAVENLPNDPTLQSPPPRIVARSLNRVVMEAQPAAPGLLVLADAYYPGWKAFVDEQERGIFRVNHVLRGVVVPAGRHKVEFRYEPLSFKLGALISVTCIVSLTLLYIWMLHRGRPSARGQ